ncbi:hypothetical protein MYX07_03475, partial [Patescibacteria group bacterium AH-259-L07]|nr:hypothetical protein [Patescibacteria group bacterium AH-259-L07]
PHGREDSQGKDFTVSKIVNGELVTKSFGVSISLKSVAKAQKKHPNVPQIHLPLNSKPDDIVRSVLALFR